jgi:hypothetical protein
VNGSPAENSHTHNHPGKQNLNTVLTYIGCFEPNSLQESLPQQTEIDITST